jgi:Domain of unknown function (DUF5004)
MFKKSKAVSIALAAMIVLAACTPDDTKDYVPVVSGNVKSVAGVWTGSSVLQRDNDAERKNFPYKSMDITGVLEFNKVKLTLQENNGAPTTFTVDHGGAPQIFRLTTGTWKVDDTEKVGMISLINNNDTIRLTLGSYNLIAENKMKLTQSRTLLGKEVITYEFNFSK